MSSRELWKKFDKIGLKKKPISFASDFTPDQINAHFGSIFSQTSEISNMTESDIIHPTFEFNEVEEYHIINAIYNIKSNAVGLDNIPIKFVKLILPLLIKPLKHLFNQILKSSIYPSMWKVSKIIPIEKKRRYPLLKILDQ